MARSSTGHRPCEEIRDHLGAGVRRWTWWRWRGPFHLEPARTVETGPPGAPTAAPSRGQNGYPRSSMRVFLRILGGTLMAVGATFVAMALGDIIGGGDGHTTRGVYAGLIVFFSAIGFGGWRLWQSAGGRGSEGAPALRVPSEPSAFDVEQGILASAARSEGRVTVGEVAMACRIPIARAKQTLEALVLAGAAEMLLTDGGDPVYRIAGLLAAAEKDAAVDPLEDVLPAADRHRR